MSGPSETSRDSRRDEILAGFLIASDADPQILAEWIARYPDLKDDLENLAGDHRFVAAAFSAPPVEPPPCFGADYEQVEEIDRGGEGAVYKAYQRSMQRIVAIKALHQSSSQPDPDRIRTEAQRAAKLSGHHHIVKVHVVDEYQGQRFFVMQYLEGKSLTRLLESGPLTPALAVQYVKTIAEAVHYAHQRQILHCDLKPRNILLDEAGEPCIADFGLSKRLGDDGAHPMSSAVEGTASYMAPEQASRGVLTTETDIYGLGAILYALLTAQPPFQADTLEETLRLVRDQPPQPPGELNPAVDRDLEAICLKSLSKDRKDRYASAYGLARDLERYQAGEETVARTWGRRERAIRWIRRRPAVAGAVAAVVLVSLLTAGMAVHLERARKAAQIEGALASNVRDAQDQAGFALQKLSYRSHQLKEFATEDELKTLLAPDDRAGAQRYAEKMCRRALDRGTNCLVLNKEGYMLGRAGPEFVEDLGTFNWRDYFKGAEAHVGLEGQHAVHISRAYISTVDKTSRLSKFTISAPVLKDGEFAGVVGISFLTDTHFGLATPPDSRRIVAVIGPKDRAGPDAGLPARFFIIAHPGYKLTDHAVEFSGRQVMADHAHELDDSPGSNVLFSPSADYTDPMGTVVPAYRKQQWIAASAPVGNTGFFVVVQTPFEDALKVERLGSWNRAFGIAFATCLAIAIAVGILERRRSVLARSSIR